LEAKVDQIKESLLRTQTLRVWNLQLGFLKCTHEF